MKRKWAEWRRAYLVGTIDSHLIVVCFLLPTEWHWLASAERLSWFTCWVNLSGSRFSARCNIFWFYLCQWIRSFDCLQQLTFVCYRCPYRMLIESTMPAFLPPHKFSFRCLCACVWVCECVRRFCNANRGRFTPLFYETLRWNCCVCSYVHICIPAVSSRVPLKWHSNGHVPRLQRSQRSSQQIPPLSFQNLPTRVDSSISSWNLKHLQPGLPFSQKRSQALHIIAHNHKSSIPIELDIIQLDS